MNSVLGGVILLGQYSNWQRLGDGLKRGTPEMEREDLMLIGVVLGALVLIALVAVKLYQRSDFSRPCNDPHKLFRQLCMIHGLDRGSRRLLQDLAIDTGTTFPATLFITPSAFQISSLSPKLRDEADRIRALAQKLF